MPFTKSVQMAAAVRNSELSLNKALEIHLRPDRHFPGYRVEWVPVAAEAVAYGDDQPDRMIDITKICEQLGEIPYCAKKTTKGLIVIQVADAINLFRLRPFLMVT